MKLFLFSLLFSWSAMAATSDVLWAKFSGGTFITNNCTTGTCTINVQNSYRQNNAWLTSIVHGTHGGQYTANFANGVFTVNPVCVGVCSYSLAITSAIVVGNLVASGSVTSISTWDFQCSDGGDYDDSSASIECVGT